MNDVKVKDAKVKEYVKKRYSEIAQAGTSCCATSCCGPSASDVALQIGYSEDDLKNIPEAASMGLGCGNPVALASLKAGETVLDLGSGGGIDIFLAAKKVGPKGRAIGVDMTKEMINKARATAEQYGFENVEFRQGDIENLPLKNNTVDVVISNCVINLATDKEKVFREAYRVLKPSGRLLITDMVTEGELPEEVKKSFAAWAGCIAGALEKNEYLDTIKRAGFANVKILSEQTFNPEDYPELLQECGGTTASIHVEATKT